jgi:pimeloyl-ACP methyl ester carboxylesterase
VVRLNYRMPNEFGECVLDTMAGLTFLKAVQYERVALIGHSFGGAVAINAGTLAPIVTTVTAVSSQLFGAHVVGELAPRPLLLLHGTADTILRTNAPNGSTSARRSPGRSSFLRASAIASPRRPTNCSKPSATGWSNASDQSGRADCGVSALALPYMDRGGPHL